MHKGVILLVKEKNREDAKTSIQEFMSNKQENTIDWWEIGGRWMGLLDDYKPYKDDSQFITCSLCNGTGLSNENDKKNTNLCTNCNGLGKKLPYTLTEHKNDIMLLKDCIEKVKGYGMSMEDKAELYWEKMLNAKKRRDKKDTLSAYYAGKYNICRYDTFGTESDVYDIEKTVHKIPDDITDYWAGIIDFHF